MTSIQNLRKKRWIFVAVICIPFFLLLGLWTQPNLQQQGTIKIWDRNGTLLYEVAGVIGKKDPVPFEKLPTHLIKAAIASEDESFFTNPGVDLKAILRSLFINLKAGSVVSGASTITQQLARSSVISPNKIPERSMIRKIREILVAIRINFTYSKKEVLNMYFNSMYFGNLAYGVQAAATTYFDKNVENLSLAESTFLVGLLSSPEGRDPFVNLQSAKQKQTQVLDLMVKNHFISKEKAFEAKQERLRIVQKTNNIKSPHFVHYILDLVGSLRLERNKGINVYTTLDYPTFMLSQEVAELWVNKLKDKHTLTNASVVLLKNDTGEILSMLGGVNYFDTQHSGQENMSVALRQPGSALKPVTYAAAFMKNYTPATLIYDVKKVFKTKKGEGYAPQNYDGRYHGLVLAREALASSFNIPAVEMLTRIGIPQFLSTARMLGVTSFNQEDRYDLSLTLGGGEVTLLDLTNVFASFGRGGIYKEPYAIEKIVTDDGRTVFAHKNSSQRIALGQKSQQVAFLISDILRDPKARIPGFGEKNPLVLSHPAAVKTGTTTDWHDNWTVGYTPSYTVGVWVGNNDNKPMREISGVVGAAPIWNQFFEEFLKGKPVENFKRPQGIKDVEICALSGMLPDGLCIDKITEKFINGTEPKKFSNLHKKVTIDIRNNLLASKDCLKEFTNEKVFINYPSEVYTWAVEENQAVLPTRFSDLCSGQASASGKTILEITNPREQAVFESAPLLVVNEKIDFEVNVSSDIMQVFWTLDNVVINKREQFPFTFSWKPVVGMHTISAKGFTENGKEIKGQDVHFSVVEFHKDQ